MYAVMASLGGLESFVVSFGVGAMAMFSLIVAAKNRFNRYNVGLGDSVSVCDNNTGHSR